MLNRYEYNRPLNLAALAIKAGSSALAKTTNAISYTIDGVVYTKAAADLTALTGIDVADGYTKIVGVYANTAGTVSFQVSAAIANATALTLADFPVEPAQKTLCLLGFIIIKAAGAAFTGGTTALDAANITVTYLDALNAVY